MRTFLGSILGFFLKRKIVTTAIAVIIVLAASAMVFAYEATRNLPDIGDVKSIIKNQTTYIYAADGTLITKLYVDNRTIIPLKQVSPILQKAVVAVEDQRFYEHGGVDYVRIIGALLRDLKSHGASQGGSTITQQYVKNAYFSPEKTIQRKIREAFLATELEHNYTKEQILEKYLNTIYFGNRAYGIEAASQAYFGIPASRLNIEQSALLAGLIRGPETYNPYKNPEEATKRRNFVIDNMLSQGFIKPGEAKQAKAKPLSILPKQQSYIGAAPYFADWIKSEMEYDLHYSENDINSRGFKIYTTLDPKMQEAAELAWKKYLPSPTDPEVSLVAIDPKTGAVKAMVGGKDYNKNKFNYAALGNGFQPGSSFKPFTLTAALMNGISPDDRFDASSPQDFDMGGGKKWAVHNYSGESGAGFVQLRRATQFSINVVYAALMLKVGVDKVIDTAKNLGITSELNPDPAITLGGLKYGVTPLEMASAYSTFANNGSHNPPYGVQKIEMNDGRLVYEHKPDPKQAIDKVVACVVNDILQSVVNGGTGTRARIGRPAAGKTGTTTDYYDAWFCGYTPDMAASVWVGFPTVKDEKGNVTRKAMSHVHGIRVAGGTFPAQIWAAFMKMALKDVKPSNFEKANRSELTWIDLCDETNLLPTEFCPTVSKHMFIRKYIKPKDIKRCAVHKPVVVPNLLTMSQDGAIQTLTGLKLGYNIINKPSTGPSGVVIEQNPAEGAQVKEGTVVEISISIPGESVPPPNQSQQPPPTDQPTVQVPDVVGKPETTAKNALKNAGFNNIEVKYDSKGDGQTSLNCVMSQTPAANSYAKPDSVVTIVIYKPI